MIKVSYLSLPLCKPVADQLVPSPLTLIGYARVSNGEIQNDMQGSLRAMQRCPTAMHVSPSSPSKPRLHPSSEAITILPVLNCMTEFARRSISHCTR